MAAEAKFEVGDVIRMKKTASVRKLRVGDPESRGGFSSEMSGMRTPGERSIILKGTHIGKDTCLYFYAEKGGSFYEIDPEQKEETILRLVEKNVVCEQAKKILIGD